MERKGLIEFCYLIIGGGIIGLTAGMLSIPFWAVPILVAVFYVIMQLLIKDDEA